MKDSSENKLSVQSDDELIEKMVAEALESLEIPFKYRDKGFDDFNIARLMNKDADLIIAELEKYAKNYINNRRTPNWLVLQGPCGSGKTHLAIAILKESLSQDITYQMKKSPNKHDKKFVAQSKDFIFAPSSELFQDLKDSYDCDDINERDVLKKYKNCSMLVIDDLGTVQTSKWYKDKLYQILNYRSGEMLPTIITTNLSSEELLEQIGQRIFDRIIESADNGKNLWKLIAYSYRRSA